MNYRALVILPCLLLASCGSSNDNSNTNDSLSAPLGSALVNENTNNAALSNTNSNAPVLDGAALEERKKLEADLANAKKLLEEAKGLDITKDQEGIKSRIATIKEKATTLRDMDDFFVEADALLQEAGLLEEHMNNFVQVTNLPQALDLSSKGKDVEIKSMFKAGNGVYAVANSSLFGPLFGKPEDLKSIPFPGGNLGTSGTYSLKFKESYIASLPGQMWKVKDGELKGQTLEEGGAWYPGSEVWSYGKSIYVLDPVSKKLWKYEQKNDGVFKKPVIAIEDPELKSSTIRSISVDGNIYILTDKELIKFTQGKRIPLETDTPLTKLSESTMIYTDQNSSFLYIFDPKGGRFLRLQKKANGLSLVKEYTIQGQYKGFFPAADGKSIYFYDAQHIFTLSL